MVFAIQGYKRGYVIKGRIQHGCYGCFSTCNIVTIYYCHRSLATAILEQSIAVSTNNSKVLNTHLPYTYHATLVSYHESRIHSFLCLIEKRRSSNIKKNVQKILKYISESSPNFTFIEQYLCIIPEHQQLKQKSGQRMYFVQPNILVSFFSARNDSFGFGGRETKWQPNLYCY